MANNPIDSTSILKQYILEHSHLAELITLDAFSKEFPKGTSSDTIKSIYNQLSQQQKRKHLVIERNIDNQFNLPLRHLYDIAQQATVSKSKVDTLVHRLAKLCQQMDKLLANQTNEVKTELTLLDETLCKLDSFDIPNDLDKELQDALTKCDKIVNLINNV